MPGVALNGSLWVGTAQVIGIMAGCFGLTGLATTVAAVVYAKQTDCKPGSEEEVDVNKTKRTRVPLDAASTVASLSSPAQKLVVPSVVEEVREEQRT